jgi:hypothetical protein
VRIRGSVKLFLATDGHGFSRIVSVAPDRCGGLLLVLVLFVLFVAELPAGGGYEER